MAPPPQPSDSKDANANSKWETVLQYAVPTIIVLVPLGWYVFRMIYPSVPTAVAPEPEPAAEMGQVQVNQEQ